MVNFNIVENAPPKYLADFEEFKEDYVKKELTVKQIKAKYNWSDRDYRKALRHALKEGVSPRKRVFSNARHYYKVNGKYCIYKEIDGKMTYFGIYSKEEDVKRVVAELKKVEWDKKQLHNIKKEVGVL